MRGYIRKRGKNSYSLTISTGLDSLTGKYGQQCITVKGTRREADRRLAELVHEFNTGTLMKPGKMTVREFLEQWLLDYAKPNLSPWGFERYAGIIRSNYIPRWGNMPLTQLRPEHLQKYYAAKLNDGLAARTVKYHHAVIHVALKTALKRGLVNRNVADAVDPPKIVRKEMQTWDESEILRFQEAAKDTPYYALFYTALYTGMRRSELLALRWQDVDFMMSQVYVNRGLHQLKDGSYIFTQPKSARSRRTVALPPSAILTLKEHLEKQKLERAMLGIALTDNALVFGTPEGEPLRPNTITRAWTMLAARCGLKVIRLHDARHSHASLMLKQGVHPKIVQERLGHASIQMTLDIYSHVAPGLQEAAAIRFDEMLNHKSENEAVHHDH